MKILKNTFLIFTACTLLASNQMQAMEVMQETLTTKLWTVMSENRLAIGLAAAAAICLGIRWAWSRGTTQLPEGSLASQVNQPESINALNTPGERIALAPDAPIQISTLVGSLSPDDYAKIVAKIEQEDRSRILHKQQQNAVQSFLDVCTSCTTVTVTQGDIDLAVEWLATFQEIARSPLAWNITPKGSGILKQIIGYLEPIVRNTQASAS